VISVSFPYVLQLHLSSEEYYFNFYLTPVVSKEDCRKTHTIGLSNEQKTIMYKRDDKINIIKVLEKILVGTLPLFSKQAFLQLADCLLARDNGWTERVNEWAFDSP
jgi:hypothetical protein